MNNTELKTLTKCTLFYGLNENEIQDIIRNTNFTIRKYDKGDIIFHLMDQADETGIILSGYVQAQKLFPNGSQINVSEKGKGELIGPAAVFSKEQKYPCDIFALEPSVILMFSKMDLITLLQKNKRILENFVSGISSATYMLQQRLELLSYSGISQKIAFYLLIHARQSGKNRVRIPDSVSNWALIMNVSRPSLHRELKKMNSLGMITYSSPDIIINDEKQLQSLLNA